jgi:hypothetical protein
MVKLSEINNAGSIEELNELGIGEVVCEISYRGGGLGFRGVDVARELDIDEGDLPRNFGVGCNYLGGGVRGAVVASGYNKKVSADKAKVLDALSEACKRAYLNAEQEAGIEDDLMSGNVRVNQVSAY